MATQHATQMVYVRMESTNSHVTVHLDGKEQPVTSVSIGYGLANMNSGSPGMFAKRQQSWILHFKIRS